MEAPGDRTGIGLGLVWKSESRLAADHRFFELPTCGDPTCTGVIEWAMSESWSAITRRQTIYSFISDMSRYSKTQDATNAKARDVLNPMVAAHLRLHCRLHFRLAK